MLLNMDDQVVITIYSVYLQVDIVNMTKNLKKQYGGPGSEHGKVGVKEQ